MFFLALARTRGLESKKIMDRRTFFEKFAICFSAFFGFFRIRKLFFGRKEKEICKWDGAHPLWQIGEKEWGEPSLGNDGRGIIFQRFSIEFSEDHNSDLVFAYANSFRANEAPEGYRKVQEILSVNSRPEKKTRILDARLQFVEDVPPRILPDENGFYCSREIFHPDGRRKTLAEFKREWIEPELKEKFSNANKV